MMPLTAPMGEHRTVLYYDRLTAAGTLAEQLEAYRGAGTVVLGIPRGGVVVAAEIARRLDAPLDVIVARKLPAPFSPELAIGAVTADGAVFLNPDVVRAWEIPEEYLRAAASAQARAARDREERYRRLRPPRPLEGQTVIVADDGLATGATMRAAVRSVRARRPARVIVAVPVGSPEACRALLDEADKVVCPSRPDPFGAVGLYYECFGQVEDAEVERLLAAPPPPPPRRQTST